MKKKRKIERIIDETERGREREMLKAENKR